MTDATLADLETLQRQSFDYFLFEANAANGLVADKNAPSWPASIAATGLALASYPVAVERGYMARDAALMRTLATLRFFWNSAQGTAPDATGYKGFYYHFLDMHTGARARECELSTVDSTFLLAGALTAGQYFAGDSPAEREVRTLADALYQRADWQWALNGGVTVTHGWTPEKGFLRYRWKGYDEAMLLYILGLGSPTHPLPVGSYSAWCTTYEWKRCYGHEYLYAGPLFAHQLSHAWVDFRGIQDDFMCAMRSDYFENSRRATHVQRQYAIENPLAYAGYGANWWGISASDGPGPSRRRVRGVARKFFDYAGRGAPYGRDDGTITPSATAASLPFAPEIVLPMLGHCIGELTHETKYGFRGSYNDEFPREWASPWHFGIHQGPVVLMIENHLTGLPWRLMRDCPAIIRGLERAGFRGGWLAGHVDSDPAHSSYA